MVDLIAEKNNDLLTIKEASVWASNFLNKAVSDANIAYLVQYGKVRKMGNNGSTLVRKNELVKYYRSFYGRREIDWKKKLGEDLNWRLSFDYLKESDTTKHVHRLHPYKGKFIPQLLEYFLDQHTDEFKQEVFFKQGDIVLDPFCGSGTTLVQANELGLHAVGLDVSFFNTQIANVKLGQYDFAELRETINCISGELDNYLKGSKVLEFDKKLSIALASYNAKYFPSPKFKYRVSRGEINEFRYGREKEEEFLSLFYALVSDYKLDLRQENGKTFLAKWFIKNIREELEFVNCLIQKNKDSKIRNVLAVVLSRTMRSCRATTHSDLATLKEPVITPYYCAKHKKICKPLFSIKNWWKTYSQDTLDRLEEFAKLRTGAEQICLTGDSREIDIEQQLKLQNRKLYNVCRRQKIKGIFSSPPYVGLIDYHEQHAYAYDLFGLPRSEDKEIGPLYKGQGPAARDAYVRGLVAVLRNCKKYLADDYNVFLVANDKYNLYPTIAEQAGLKIVKQYKRPVLNRTEKDKGAYAEIIFQMKES
jgi:hypothetical protein